MISYTILYSGVIYFTSMNREEKNKICQLLRRRMWRKYRFHCYMKKNFSQGTIQNEYVNAEQSSLYYLRDYLQILDHAW